MRFQGKSKNANRSVIATCWFTGKRDPQRGRQNRNTWSPIGRWANSVKKHGLHGIVFHDGYTDEFVEHWSNEHLSFVKIDTFSGQDLNAIDYRWIVYRDYFAENKHDKIFVTDCQDVVVLQPFMQYVKPDCIYTGAENEWIPTHNLSKAPFTGKIISYYYGDDFQHYDKHVINAGILGGNYEFFMTAVDAIAAEIERLSPSYSVKGLPSYVDMAVLNHVIYSTFSHDKILYGPPVHTKFTWGQRNRKDCWLAHK